MTLIVTGHETTASALVWASYLIAFHPEVWQRFQAEADAVDEDVLRATGARIRAAGLNTSSTRFTRHRGDPVEANAQIFISA